MIRLITWSERIRKLLTKIITSLQISNEKILKVLNVKLKAHNVKLKHLHSYIPLKTFSKSIVVLSNPSVEVIVIKVMTV